MISYHYDKNSLKSKKPSNQESGSISQIITNITLNYPVFRQFFSLTDYLKRKTLDPNKTN